MARRLAVALVTICACAAAAAPAGAEPAVGVVDGSGNVLVTFDTATPGTYTSFVPITGLQPGEQIAGLSFRVNPLNLPDAAATAAAMKLYGLGVTPNGATDSVRVYTIDPGTGVATPVSAAPVGLLAGEAYGFGFNPKADRLRVTNSADENARLNPNNGARADLPVNDTDLNPAGQRVVAVAYDRYDADPGTETTLFGLSDLQASTFTIGSINGTPNSPNGGALSLVGPLGTGALGGLLEDLNYDISPSGVGYATLVPLATATPGLYTVNESTGAATLIGSTPTGLRALGIVPAASARFSAASYSQLESAGPATITVDRGGSATGTVAVAYNASDGSASGTLTFGPGETSKTFAVPVANDATKAPDRVVTLSLSATTPLVGVASPGSATLTIVDDDLPNVPPNATLSGKRSLSLAAFLKRGVRVGVKPSEPVRLQATLLGTVNRAQVSAYNLTLASRTLGRSGATRTLTLKPKRRLVGKPRRGFSVRVRIVATDAAGASRTLTRTIKVKVPRAKKRR